MDGPVFLDFFAGFGGSSSGLVEAGFELSTAYNHWETAIAVHAANHRRPVPPRFTGEPCIPRTEAPA